MTDKIDPKADASKPPTEAPPKVGRFRRRGPKAAPLTEEQRKRLWQRNRARELRDLLNEVLEDDEHIAWATIDRLWNAYNGFSEQNDPARAAHQVVAEFFDFMKNGADEFGDPLVPSRNMYLITWPLRQIDPAFAALDSAHCQKIIARRVGAWNTLARLAHSCGALGCKLYKGEPPYETAVKPTIDRWKDPKQKSDR